MCIRDSNTTAWKHAVGLLTHDYYLLMLQETFLLKDKILGAVRGVTFFFEWLPKLLQGDPVEGLASCANMASHSRGWRKASMAAGPVVSPLATSVLVAGDWNFEPTEMPCDVIHGGHVCQPLSHEAATCVAWGSGQAGLVPML
eukprot:5099242-Amphidinium_carterae.2